MDRLGEHWKAAAQSRDEVQDRARAEMYQQAFTEGLCEIDLWIRWSLKDFSPEQIRDRLLTALDDNAVAMGYVKRCDGSYFQTRFGPASVDAGPNT